MFEDDPMSSSTSWRKRLWRPDWCEQKHSLSFIVMWCLQSNKGVEILISIPEIAQNMIIIILIRNFHVFCLFWPQLLLTQFPPIDISFLLSYQCISLVLSLVHLSSSLIGASLLSSHWCIFLVLLLVHLSCLLIGAYLLLYHSQASFWMICLYFTLFSIICWN